jgi:uncharacterized protein YbjT (DUF2867 family)
MNDGRREKTAGRRIVVFGATGMVGEGVVHEALRHPAVNAVLVIGRRSCGISHRKLKEIVHADFFDYASIEDQLRGHNACFFCLGVTSIGRKEEEYRRLTYDLTMAAARTLSRLNPEMDFAYVSGAGTDISERGQSMWARVKGKTENDLMKLPFKAVYAFRPGYIKPTPGLRHAISISRWIAPLYPVLHALLLKYVCTLEDVGLAMIRVVTDLYAKKVLECSDITALGRK